MTIIHRNNVLRTIAFMLSIMVTSCNYTKHLSENQTLLNSNKIDVKLDKPIKYKGELESSIATLSNPQPNSHMLDLGLLPKYKLWKYNYRYKYFSKHDTDIKIIKRKVEKPVLVDSNTINRSQAQIRQFMVNQGYFYANVKSEIKPIGNKSADVHYSIQAGKSYFTNEVRHQVKSEGIKSIIEANKALSYLKKGEVFANYKCGLERERFYKIIRNEGYYDFKTDNISFTLDTTNKSKIKNLLIDPLDAMAGYEEENSTASTDSLNILVAFEQTKDSTYDLLYIIDSVQVTLIDKSVPFNPNLPMIVNELDGIEFRYQTLPVNRKVITRNIFIAPGDVYSTKAIESSTNRLNQLNVFQFVNIQFQKRTDTPGRLICNIVLTTNPKMDLVSTTELSNSDDYYLGIGASVTYRNRNLFHGANQLMVRLSPSIEFRNDKQLTGKKQFYNSGLNINLNTSLTFPKFIVPFNQNVFNKKNKPYTMLGLNYSYLRRQQSYAFINVSGNFGYTWQETEQKNWKFSPAFLTLSFLPESLLSPTFSEKIANSPYLRNIYSTNVIQGENVTFEYQGKPRGPHNSFNIFRITFEEAGSLLNGINLLYESISNQSIPSIANYLRTEIDARHYSKYRKSEWVNRLNLGVGIPLFDNETLPYIKQFSAGGPYSMRGWRVRTLGPGRSADSSFITSNNASIDRTGDLKFELNTEYRFDIVKLFSGAINLKGATFIDVGNIWLLRKSADIQGGEFDPSYLLQDLAIGSGAGLRLDFSFFILRVDLGFPIKKPNLTENNGFNFQNLTRKSGIWAINFGYPF